MAKRATRIERCKEVRAATMDTLERATNLVRVHNEATVKNRRPRASLNAVVVPTAMGAWERFLADAWSAQAAARLGFLACGQDCVTPDAARFGGATIHTAEVGRG